MTDPKADRSRFFGSWNRALLDTPRPARILSIEALFLEPERDVCAVAGAFFGWGSERKAVSNRKQTVVGSKVGRGMGVQSLVSASRTLLLSAWAGISGGPDQSGCSRRQNF